MLEVLWISLYFFVMIVCAVGGVVVTTVGLEQRRTGWRITGMAMVFIFLYLAVGVAYWGIPGIIPWL